MAVARAGKRSSGMARAVLIGALLLAGMMPFSTNVSAGDWTKTDMGMPNNATVVYGLAGVAVGDGDRDNLTEVYFTSGDAAHVYSYEWINGSPVMEDIGAFGTDIGIATASAVIVGDADDDGQEELYVGGTMRLISTFGTHLFQIVRSENGWVDTDIGSTGFFTGNVSNLAIGDGDNDGKTELYAIETADKALIEFSKGNIWNSKMVGNSLFQDVVVGDGDNDGKNEVYGANYDYHLYRFNWSDGMWIRSDMGIAEEGAPGLTAVTMGDGDNDGANELYAGSWNGSVWRYKWNPAASAWYITRLASLGPGNCTDMCLGDGNSDGMNELYVAHETGRIYQVLYNSSTGKWESDIIGSGNGAMRKIAIGSTSADKRQKEIYAACADGHAYRFLNDSWAPDNPQVWSDTHPDPGTWYSYNRMHVLWKDIGNDFNGIGGYSILWDRTPGTVPDDTVDVQPAVHNAWSGPLADGSDWYFHIRACDGIFNWNSSAAHFGPVKIDTTPPRNMSLAIDGGTEWTSNKIAELCLTADDISGIALMAFSNDGQNWGGWETYNALRSGWDLTDPQSGGADSDGIKYVFAKAQDIAGNEVSPENWSMDSIILDRQAPIELSIAINGGAASTNSPEVVLTLGGLDPDPASGLWGMHFSNDGKIWGNWTDWNGTAPWSLTEGAGGTDSDGDKTVFFEARDGALNIGRPVNASILLDRLPPGESRILIDNGAECTNDSIATLTVSASEPDPGSGLALMALANNESIQGTFEPYSTSRRGWSLVNGTGGTGADGPKTVFLRLRDGAGNIAGPVNDTIFLDRVRPGGLGIVINGGAAVTINTGVMLALNASDPEPSSGLWSMQFSDDGSNWSGWEPYNASKGHSLPPGDGLRTVHFRVQDRAGNIADAVHTSIRLDTTSPVISDVRISVTSSSAIIKWLTDEDADGAVDFGADTSFGSTKADPAFGVRHQVTLTGLAAQTTYMFQAYSKDRAGNPPGYSGPLSFTTADTPDMTPPVISDIQVSGITDRLAVVSWQTGEPADSTVAFGTTTQYGLKASDPGYLLKHSLVLTGLQPSTTYHLRVSSKDPAGNFASGPDITFNTTATPDAAPPVISDVRVTGITDRLAVVSWQTDEPADSSVEFGPTGPYGRNAISNAYSILHQLVLTGLQPATTYHFRVASKDPSGNGPAFGPDLMFTTGNAPDTQPPVISAVRVQNITANSAVISWVTSEPADGLLEYGPNSSMRSSLASDFFSTNHRFVLRGLSPGATYHFRVSSTDPTGNPSQPGADMTFRTDHNPLPPPAGVMGPGGFSWLLAYLVAVIIPGLIIFAAILIIRLRREAVPEADGDVETVEMDRPDPIDMDEPETVEMGKPGTLDMDEPETVEMGAPGTLDMDEPETVEMGAPGTANMDEPETVDMD